MENPARGQEKWKVVELKSQVGLLFILLVLFLVLFPMLCCCSVQVFHAQL